MWDINKINKTKQNLTTLPRVRILIVNPSALRLGNPLGIGELLIISGIPGSVGRFGVGVGVGDEGESELLRSRDGNGSSLGVSTSASTSVFIF